MALFQQAPDKDKFQKSPEEWVEAARKRPAKQLLPVDEVFEAIWPD